MKQTKTRYLYKTRKTYLNSYIDLQRQRFGSKLTINTFMNGGRNDLMIEPMLLVSFVENAFKHGTVLTENAEITIQLSVQGSDLTFLVRNRYQEEDDNRDNVPGIGLVNVKRRLELLYENRHTFSINRSDGFFTILLTLQLPLMLRCIAIDDEPLALDLLEDKIRKLPYLELVATCEQPLQALTLLREENIDLVFIDIQMPGISGLQFINNAPAGCMFILITAFEKYALEGYNLNVVDYLVKPVEFDRFVKACGKALELFTLKNNSANTSKPPSEYFFVNVEYSLVKNIQA